MTMLTVRDETEQTLGHVTDDEFALAEQMAKEDLNANNGGIYTVKEYQNMVNRFIQIIRIHELV